MLNNENVQKLLKQLQAEGDHAYCISIRKSQAVECLGWEYKAQHGKFGANEFKAHQDANVMFGRHEGLYRAEKILSDALAEASSNSKSPLLDNEEDPVKLWAEIHRLRGELKDSRTGNNAVTDEPEPSMLLAIDHIYRS